MNPLFASILSSHFGSTLTIPDRSDEPPAEDYAGQIFDDWCAELAREDAERDLADARMSNDRDVEGR